MNFISKKASLVILAATAAALSRLMFVYFDDVAGPNLLIVTVAALIVFLISASVYAFGSQNASLKKLLGSVFVQIIVVLLMVMLLGNFARDGGAPAAPGLYTINPELKGTASEQANQAQAAPGDHPEVDHAANEGVAANQPADMKTSITWRFSNAGESDNIPYTSVTVILNNKPYEMGKFQGSCSVVGADGKAGIDGKGLLTGELSAAQCWFAGGGDEIGVFAHEDGGFDIMTGELGEGVEGGAFFRGNFKMKQTVRP